MPTLAVDGQLIYFAHCPKAGGTSVERFMVDQWGPAVGMLGWGWDRKWARRGERAGEIPSSPQHYVWQDALRVLPRPPDHVFTVVRDPVARMTSEWRYQRSRRLTGPFGRPLRGLGFSTWLRLMFSLADRNPYTHDNHFRSQVDFMPPENVTLFRLEDGLAPVLGWLCDITGAAAPDAPPHDLKGSSDALVLPTSEDAMLIQERYRADYLRFGYPLLNAAEISETAREGRQKGMTQVFAPLLDGLYRRGLV